MPDQPRTNHRILQLSRRRLPHLYMLHNSLPPHREIPARLRAWIACWTKRALASIHKGDPGDYLLRAWVVMPNHVHLLLTPNIEPSVVLRRMKGASARQANKLLGLTGQPFWQGESYDHLVRSQEEFERIENYILQNPVRAGLARSEEEYPWSSIFDSGGLKPAAG